MKKREKFEEIAERRVSEVLYRISLLGNLSNSNNYDYTENHIKQIFSSIRKELKAVEMQFSNNSKSDVKKFKFKQRDT